MVLCYLQTCIIYFWMDDGLWFYGSGIGKPFGLARTRPRAARPTSEQLDCCKSSKSLTAVSLQAAPTLLSSHLECHVLSRYIGGDRGVTLSPWSATTPSKARARGWPGRAWEAAGLGRSGGRGGGRPRSPVRAGPGCWRASPNAFHAERTPACGAALESLCTLTSGP